MGNSLLGGKVYSAAIVLSQEVIAKIGYFDEEFSGWGCEDDEYVIRANRLKVPIVVCSGNLYHISHAPAADKRADLHAKNSELLHRLIKLPIEDLKKRHNLP
jgi:GT2 family glycosyltransferase